MLKKIKNLLKRKRGSKNLFWQVLLWGSLKMLCFYRNLVPTCTIHFFPKHKIIYVEIPKTGCTSIKIALNKLENPELKINDELKIHKKMDNSSVIKVKKLKFLFNGIYKDWKKVTVVRNPYDRLLSLYKDPTKNYSEKSFETFLESIKKKWCDDPHCKPQIKIIGRDLSIYDHVGSTENMQDTFKYLSKITGGKIKYKHCNKGIALELKVDDKNKKTIYQMYRNDFLILDYENEIQK